MKKVLLLIFAFALTSIGAQEKNYSRIDSTKFNNKWTFGLGFNVVDNNGNRSSNPFNNFIKLDEEAFGGIPLKLDVEYRFNDVFALAASGSMNRWKAGKGYLDNTLTEVDVDYFAVDGALKLYIDEALNVLKNSDWLEVYASAGLGYFEITDGGVSANLGAGANFWILDNFGINLNGTAKWALAAEPALYETKHVQYSAGIVYRIHDNDIDNDGIYDYNDQCPNVAGSREREGCPEPIAKVEEAPVIFDRDNDGVPDNVDQCPEEPGKPGNNGCPILDTDNDGVVDSADNCPNIPGPTNNAGCPIVDTDGDGVVDGADDCPNVVGLASNKGCPLKKDYLLEMSALIQFNTASFSFRDDAYPTLNSIFQYISANPNHKYKIEGHTDSVGSDYNNRKLSIARANAVRNYLIKNGIPASSLIAVGLGETRPIDTNQTIAGRAVNRRIEMSKLK